MRGSRADVTCSQQPLRALEPEIKKFHSSLLRLRNTGNFKVTDLANKKGVKKIGAQSGQSGLDKRQAPVQLTVFADGVDRVRPTVIF